eukprot:COSAG02_NODE_34701_length_480_cov_0.532808_1_plen_100_part_01
MTTMALSVLPLLLLLLLAGGFPEAAGSEEDVAALQGVLKGLRKAGSYGRLKGSWRSGTDPCAAGGWEGVTCDEADESIIGLDLSYLSLEGTLAPEVGELR